MFGLFKPNDWQIVFKSAGTYSTYQHGFVKEKGLTYYAYLKYSESRDKFKIEFSIETSGDGFHNGGAYQDCLDEQIRLEKEDRDRKNEILTRK